MTSKWLKELEIHCKDVYFIRSPLDLTFLFSFCKTIESTHEHLVKSSFIPQPPQDLERGEDIFSKALKEDILLHHPYESFKPVVGFITQAIIKKFA